jgi:hypothetical protein
MDGCEKYQELISRMIDGELGDEEKTEFEEHIASCPECAALYRAFASVSEELSGGLEEPPAELKDGVMAAVGGKGKIVRFKRWKEMLAVAACLALVIAGAAKLGVFQSGAQTMATAASSAQSGEDDSAAAGEKAYDSAPAAGDAGVTAMYPETANDTQSQKNLVGAAAPSVSSAQITGPDGQYYETGDENAISKLSALLEKSKTKDLDTINTSSEESGYQVTLPGMPTITVTVNGESLVCTDSETGETYAASGTAAEFTALLKELG